MQTIRLLIADDHRVYREGLRALLDGEAAVAIIGEAGSGDEVVARAIALEPDVILMDLKMPGLNGIEATRRIRRDQPQARVLVVTMFDDDESVFAAMRAGARGYLLKDADHEELLRAIQAVYRGEAIFSPPIAQRMMDYFAALPNITPRDAGPPFPELTEREREILDHIARGENNAAIAQILTLSMKTVQNHISNIFNKLQVADRAQAIIRARDAGLGRAEE